MLECCCDLRRPLQEIGETAFITHLVFGFCHPGNDAMHGQGKDPSIEFLKQTSPGAVVSDANRAPAANEFVHELRGYTLQLPGSRRCKKVRESNRLPPGAPKAGFPVMKEPRGLGCRTLAEPPVNGTYLYGQARSNHDCRNGPTSP